jgi:hypothetical protein
MAARVATEADYDAVVGTICRKDDVARAALKVGWPSRD